MFKTTRLPIKWGILLFISLFNFNLIHAHNSKLDSLLSLLKTAKEDTLKVNILNNIGQLYSNKGQQDSSEVYINKALQAAQLIQTFSRQNNQKGWLPGIAASYSQLASTNFYRGSYKTAADYAFKALEIYTSLDNKKSIAQTLFDIGIYYSLQSEFTKGIDYFFRALKIFENINHKPGISRCYYSIGNVYSNLENYDEAINYDLKALKISEELNNNEEIAAILINIGVAYLGQGNYSKALEYFLRALKINEIVGDIYMEANLMANIGDAYKSKNQSDKAMPFFSKAIDLFEKLGSQGNKAFVLQKIGEIHLENKNYSEAEKNFTQALNISTQIGSLQQIRDVNYNLSILFEKIGKNQKALEYYKEFVNYKDSIFNQENVKKITQTEMNFEFEKKELAAKAEQEKKEIIMQANANRKQIITGGSIILLTSIMLLLIRQQRLRRRKDKVIFESKQKLSEKENALLKLEKQQIQEELISSKKALDNYMDNLIQKNVLLEQFNIEIEKLKNLKSKELYEEKIEQLDSLTKLNIITEEDWAKFKKLYEEVYKGFFTKLKEKLPELTQAETRLICLTKLKLDTKQMACVLGVSPDTITKTRYRLRKKIGADGELSLDEIIQSV